MEKSKKTILIVLMMGLFVAAIEWTVVATAMPKAVSSLGGVEIYNWVFTAYILTATVSGPLWGRLSDFHGRRSIYVLGIALFLIGSALSGAASTMPQLVIFRGIQGLGAGALFIMTFTIVGEVYQLEERAKAQGYMSSVWAVASLVGPLVGGVITDSLNWRWVFYINIPFGLVAIILAWRHLRGSVDKENGSLDVMGATLFAIGTTAMLTYLNEYSTLGEWGLVLLVASGVSLPLFLRVELKARTPLIPLDLFREPFIRTAVMGNLLAGFTFFGSIAYIPILLQWVVGLSATETGFSLIPFTMGWVASSNISARLLIRVGTRPLTTLGALSLMLGMLIIAIMKPDVLSILASGSLAGVGAGAIVPTLLISTQTLVPRQVLGITTSLLNFMRTMGGALGVVLMWVPISAAIRASGISLNVANLSLDVGKKLILSNAISQAFAIGLAAAALSIPLYLSLPKIVLKEKPER